MKTESKGLGSEKSNESEAKIPQKKLGSKTKFMEKEAGDIEESQVPKKRRGRRPKNIGNFKCATADCGYRTETLKSLKQHYRRVSHYSSTRFYKIGEVTKRYGRTQKPPELRSIGNPVDDVMDFLTEDAEVTSTLRQNEPDLKQKSGSCEGASCKDEEEYEKESSASVIGRALINI